MHPFLLILLMTPFALVAQDGPPPPPPSSDFTQTLVMIGVALIFFYFILWRPEQKRRQAVEQQREKMKKGDKVTAMGIIGTVEKVDESTVVLKMYDGSLVEFVKGAVVEVHE